MNIESFVAVDFETATYDRMACQIGIAVFNKEGEVIDQFESLIKPPENKFDENTIRIHHITPDMTDDAPTFAELWPQIKKYFDCDYIVAHNASFDWDVLKKNLAFYNIPLGNIREFLCTCIMYDRHNLEDLCQAFDLSFNGHHDALFDAVTCGKFFYFKIQGIEPDYSKISHTKHSGMMPNKRIDHDLLVQDLTNADPNNPFYDKKVVITGDFNLNRKEVAQILKLNGADVNTTVSKRTDYVLVGENPGPSKLAKIENLASSGFIIKVIHEKEFDEFLQGDFSNFK